MMEKLNKFRRDVITLWHAFWDPTTPFYLKVIMALTALYVLSPADFIPDLIPILGWVDDFMLATFVVSWVISRLPQKAHVFTQADARSFRDGPTIDGTARRR